ncbi:hypothetical protein F4778DRAFT_799378 [Xylariomycetidae sp. FL2044]|nr:hypothetical protein F4778DRAFT_799378 [Xylariomycetidae sp. FL2044]
MADYQAWWFDPETGSYAGYFLHHGDNMPLQPADEKEAEENKSTIIKDPQAPKRTKQKRKTRACDPCQVRHIACEGHGFPCDPCVAAGRECTDYRPRKKRGPKKPIQQEIIDLLEENDAAIIKSPKKR